MIKIVAEIGINHNGSIDICKELINLAQKSGCQYAKIQKRDPDVCVPENQKLTKKNTPWGVMNYIDYKHKIEFNEEQIKELAEYSNNIGITFFASVWDIESAKLMRKYTNIVKIPSAMITNLELCKLSRSLYEFVIISTGMSTEQEITDCVNACNPDVILHTNSTYPCPPKDTNLKYILHLKNKFPKKEIGYSGHESGLVTTFASIPLGATWVERHITLDKTMWGSDQSSSISPSELTDLVKGIREIECALEYEPADRILFNGEEQKKKSLRPVFN